MNSLQFLLNVKVFDKLFLILILNSTSTGFNSWITNSSTGLQKYPMYNDLMTEIIEDCYRDFNSILILDKNLKQSIHSVAAHLSKNIILIDRIPKNVFYIDIMVEFDAIFLVTKDYKELVYVMRLLMDICAWKFQPAIFVLLKEADQCQNVLYYLWSVLWKLKLLTGFFICTNEDKPVIMTYNPFRAYASNDWNFLTKFGNQFTVFSRQYSKGNLCPGFHFDRTKYLSGTMIQSLVVYTHEMLAELPTAGYYYSPKSSRIYMMQLRIGNIIESISKLMGMEFSIAFSSFDKAAGIKLISTLRPDIYFLRDLKLNRFYSISYPAIQHKCHILSHHQGYQSIFEQIYHLFGIWIILYTLCLLFLTFLVCWRLAKKDKIGFAMFEILRLLINSSIKTIMGRASLRVFFLMVFLYFLIIQSVFQSQMAKFLTNPSAKKNADTLEDLKSDQFTKILTTTSLSSYMKHDPVLEIKLVTIESYADIERQFVHDKSVVIFNVISVLKHIILVNDDTYFYLSKTSIVDDYEVYMISNQSPFKDRLNKALLTLWDVGRSGLLMRLTDEIGWYKFARNQALSENLIKPISVSMLEPVFIFLSCGLLLSTLCFLIELIVGRKKLNKRKINISSMPHCLSK